MLPAPSRTPEPQSGSREKRTLAIVFFTVFLDLVGFGIIIPIQPFYAESLGASPAMVTLLGASFSLMQFLFAPFWGRLSDCIGRRPVMLTSIAISAGGYLAFALTRNLPMLFAARMLAGFGSANIGAAQAIIADCTAPNRRAKGMGLIGAAFGLGFIFGPALGGSLSQFGLTAPLFLAAALSALNWISAFFILPETLVTTRPDNVVPLPRAKVGFSWAALEHAMRHPNVRQLFLLYLLFTIAFSCMEQVLGLFIEKVWISGAVTSTMRDYHAKKAAAMTAYVLFLIGITATVIQGGLIGKLAKKFGERKLLVMGTILVGFSLLMIPFLGRIGSFALFLAFMPITAVGTGFINPSLSSLLSQSVDSHERGGALGLGQSLSALGRVVGPSMAGALFELNYGAPFLVGAGLTLACTGVAVTLRRAHEGETEE